MRGAWSRAGLVLAAVLVIDQVSKALVRRDVDLSTEHSVFPLVKITHTRNRGVAFGAFENSTALVVIVIGLAVLALLVYFATHQDRALVWLPTGLLAGGAIGNVFDRVQQGYVTDFVKLPHWPAFNVADMAITFGVLALLLVVEGGERDRAPDPA